MRPNAYSPTRFACAERYANRLLAQAFGHTSGLQVAWAVAMASFLHKYELSHQAYSLCLGNITTLVPRECVSHPGAPSLIRGHRVSAVNSGFAEARIRPRRRHSGLSPGEDLDGLGCGLRHLAR
jgi:hypothetical protein